MSDDRRTPVPTRAGDWRSRAFDVAELEPPYALRVLQGGLWELDEQTAKKADVRAEVRQWQKTFERRIAIAVKAAAEQTGQVIAERIVAELSGVRNRLEAVETACGIASERASQAELIAKKAVDETGRHGPVYVNVDLPTPRPPAKESDAPPSIIRYAVKRYRWARYVGVALGFVAAVAWAAWEAWKASK